MKDARNRHSKLFLLVRAMTDNSYEIICILVLYNILSAMNFRLTFDLLPFFPEDAKPEESAVPEHPEMAVFATFTNVAKYPSKISALGEMADTSERLRQVSTGRRVPPRYTQFLT